MKVRFNHSIGFGLSLLILLVSTAASYVNIHNLRKTSKLITHTDSITNELRTVMLILRDAERDQQAYLLTGEKEFLVSYNGADGEIKKTFTIIRQLTKDDEVQKLNCDHLQKVLNEQMIHLQKLVDSKNENKTFTVSDIKVGKQKMDEVQSLSKIIENRSRLTPSAGTARFNLYMTYIPKMIIVAAMVGMLINIILYLRVKKDLKQKVLLQQELKINEQNLNTRLEVIQEIADKHTKLQSANADLESIAKNLQSSKEVLGIQQAALLKANNELEARTLLLEEKNKTILEKNIEIQTRGDELVLSTKYKSEFLTNMSHELRTPLNSILLLSNLMVANHDNTLNKEHVEYATVIQRSGKGLLALIDEILDLSKIESGKMKLNYEDTWIDDVVTSMRDLFTPAARQKNIELLMHVDAAAQMIIQTDRMRLEQVIKNLLSNALKFTPSGGEVSLLVFRPLKESDNIAFAIKDTGIGIAVQKQQVVFEAFQQADDSTQRHYGGTGLGLSISRELVKLLRGRIVLNSEPGKGSEFIIYFPVAKLAEEHDAGETGIVENNSTYQIGQDGTVKDQINKLQINGHNNGYAKENDSFINSFGNYKKLYELQEHLGGKTVLIVDDDVRSIFSITKALEAFKMNILSAIDGKEALQQLQEHRSVDIILMDMIMPGIDGYESMIRIRKEPAMKKLPVIAVTANAMKGDREKCIKAGASDYIAKPVEMEKLLSLLNVWL